MPGSQTLLRGGLALLLFAGAIAARQPFCTGDLFTFDAADYERADRNGAWAQYRDADAVSLLGFGERYRTDAVFRAHPWGILYQQNDGAALRHFHAPAGFYLAAQIENAGWGRAAQRWAIAFTSAAAIAISFLILAETPAALSVAFAFGLFLCRCPVLILAGTSFSPHAQFTALAISAMFGLCRWLETNSRAWLAVFAVCCGAAIGTLELSPLLVVAALVTVVIARRRSRSTLTPVIRPTIKPMLAAFAGSGAVAAAIWPGGILRGGYVMSYGVFVFQGIFRSGLYFGERSFASSIHHLGQSWTVGILLSALLVFAVWTAFRVRRSITLLGFTVLAVLLFAQGLANGFRNATYASHAVFTIVIAAGLAIQLLLFPGISRTVTPVDRFLARLAFVATGLITIGMIVGPFRIDPATAAHDPQRIAKTISVLRSRYPAGTTFVATEDPQAFIASAPEFRFFGANGVTSVIPESWVHLDRYYLLFDREAGTPPAGVSFCSPDDLASAGYLISCQPL